MPVCAGSSTSLPFLRLKVTPAPSKADHRATHYVAEDQAHQRTAGSSDGHIGHVGLDIPALFDNHAFDCLQVFPRFAAVHAAGVNRKNCQLRGENTALNLDGVEN